MNDFDRLEYETLRKEIENSKQRLFLIASGGISILTGVDYLAITSALENSVFSLLLPLLVMAFALIFLSQHDAKFRAGRYIKDYIEPQYRGKAPGWEHWVGQHRGVDNYIRRGFLIIFIAYYSFSAYLAGKAVGLLKVAIDATFVQYFVWFCFSIAGVVFIIYFMSHSKVTQSSDDES